ncbi:YfhO family protein [Spongiimicrobium salis]|uniref:YfhO family protein n=1 Tax=Spongiimicrobium salis TaxID=1667022 RepID=UPI00374CA071
MNTGIKVFFTHFFVTVFFIVIALAYFHPVLQGKAIFQSDIVHYTGMAKEQNDFRKENKEEPYWTNSAFGGMPTYQLGANYPHNYVKKLDRLIRFLPRPADYLFLYFIGFYILLCCLKVDFRLAILGALAFGFSTYMIIILGVGHNAKAHALGYLPMLLGGIVLVFRKKYLWGALLSAMAMALEVGANHYQMTYYFMLLVLILGVVYMIDAIRKKELKSYFLGVGILLVSVTLGIAANATGLMATKEYADWSTRGKSELTIEANGATKENTNGLSKEYITQYSYGISESLNLFVPRLFGGSGGENLGEDSKTFKYLVDHNIPRTNAREFSEGLPLYWGSQPIVAGPAYIGAVIFFLFILGLFVVKGKHKWWLLGGVIMSLLLSWGKNFGVLTDFMIDYFPMYNKFRAVSSIQVVLELCAPILGVLALAELSKSNLNQKEKLRSLKISFLIVAGLGVALLLFKGAFDFTGAKDEVLLARGLPSEWMDVIQLDRRAVYTSDTIRSLLFVIATAAVLWLSIKGRMKQNFAILALGALLLLDLVGVGRRYVDSDDFVRQRQMTTPYQATSYDKQILADTTIFRVFDQAEQLNGSRTSYFHKSIGGYHAAKPARMEDLFYFHIAQNNIGVWNMLNIKYVIQQDQEGRSYAAVNPDAYGNAWFIEKLEQVKSSDEEILALGKFDLANVAVVNTNTFPNINRFDFQKDSTASISLVKYQPNQLIYESTNPNAGIAVFSEMYYANGWNAYVDGKLQDHFRVNYALRALRLTAGTHKIEFKFEPELIKTGSTITLASSIVLGVLAISSIVFSFLRSRKKEEEA